VVEWNQILIAFLAGGALGTIGAAMYSSSQERAERFRERMLRASDSFLAEVGRLRSRTFEVGELADQFAIARQEMIAAAMQPGYDDAASAKPLRALMTAVERNWSPYTSAGAGIDLKQAVSDVREFTGALSTESDASPKTSRLMDAAIQYADLIVPFYRTHSTATNELDALNIALARIRVLFSRPGDQVSQAAGKIVISLGNELRSAADRGRSNPTDGSVATRQADGEDSSSELVPNLHMFAVLVGERLRRRRL